MNSYSFLYTYRWPDNAQQGIIQKVASDGKTVTILLPGHPNPQKLNVDGSSSTVALIYNFASMAFANNVLYVIDSANSIRTITNM